MTPASRETRSWTRRSTWSEGRGETTCGKQPPPQSTVIVAISKHIRMRRNYTRNTGRYAHHPDSTVSALLYLLSCK